MSRIHYTTHDGGGEFTFNFVEMDGGDWRAYIEDAPSYGSRSTQGGAAHTYTDEDGDKYICWTRDIRSLADAKKIASMWAELTMRYIRTGVSF